LGTAADVTAKTQNISLKILLSILLPKSIFEASLLMKFCKL
jgi:hypothetical protein